MPGPPSPSRHRVRLSSDSGLYGSAAGQAAPRPRHHVELPGARILGARRPGASLGRRSEPACRRQRAEGSRRRDTCLHLHRGDSRAPPPAGLPAYRGPAVHGALLPDGGAAALPQRCSASGGRGGSTWGPAAGARGSCGGCRASGARGCVRGPRRRCCRCWCGSSTARRVRTSWSPRTARPRRRRPPPPPRQLPPPPRRPPPAAPREPVFRAAPPHPHLHLKPLQPPRTPPRLPSGARRAEPVPGHPTHPRRPPRATQRPARLTSLHLRRRHALWDRWARLRPAQRTAAARGWARASARPPQLR